MKHLLSLVALGLVATSQAHDLLADTVRVVITDNGTFVSVGLHRGDKLAGDLDAQIRNRLKLRQGGTLMTFGKPTIMPSKADDMVYWQAPAASSGTGGYSLDDRIRPEVQGMPTALVVFRDGVLVDQHLYSASAAKPPTEQKSPIWLIGVGALLVGACGVGAVRSWRSSSRSG
ncbi:MAG: hypothetical protein JST12_06180 [Armatimonadetes bacterium]|nr:hypothetical protein [Armatimonadota bacterium]